MIEGDFGGGLKVDAYIHGGEGTAQEAVAELGFGIYRTKELAELADWMRSYNAEAAEGRDLHFYGMDMQRYDNNKEYLFSVLDEAAPELSEEYKEIFSQLTDDNRYVLDNSALEQAQTDAMALLKAMDERRRKSQLFRGKGISLLPGNVQTVFMNPASCVPAERTTIPCGMGIWRKRWNGLSARATAASFSLMDITGISVKVRFRAIPALARA